MKHLIMTRNDTRLLETFSDNKPRWGESWRYIMIYGCHLWLFLVFIFAVYKFNYPSKICMVFIMIASRIVEFPCPIWLHICSLRNYWNFVFSVQFFIGCRRGRDYGSWIYNYLCNQCLSPQKLWVRTPFMARCTRYNIVW